MKYYKNILQSLVFYCVSAFGISLSIAAGIGVSAFNAMTLSFSTLSHIKVGTITLVFNLAFLLLYMVLTRFKYYKKYLIQAMAAFLFGHVINIFYYGLLSQVSFDKFWLNCLLIALGTLVSGAAVGMIVSLDAITFPLENLCMVMSQKTQKSFAFYRYSLDLLFLGVSITITLLFRTDIYIGMGTLISFLIFTFSVSQVKNLYEKKRLIYV